MTPQEAFVEGAETWAREHGERHGYSMLAAGLENVLKQVGYTDIPGLELTSKFHDPLVNYHEQAVHPETLDVRQPVIAINEIMRRNLTRPVGSEDMEIDRFARRFAYRPRSGLNTYAISKQIDEHLRAQRIRRGSKRYQKFIDDNAGRIRAALREAAVAHLAHESEVNERMIRELMGDRARIQSMSEHFERLIYIHDALVAATGVEGWNLTAKVEERRAKYASAIQSIDDSIRRLRSEFTPTEENIQELIDAAVLQDTDLRALGSRLPGGVVVPG